MEENAALSVGREVLAERMREQQKMRSPEERKANAIKAGLASASVTTSEQKQERQKLGVESLRRNLNTPEKKLEHFKKTGAGRLTKEQLSANGTKGATKLNNSKTPAERSAQARKAAQALHAKRAAIKLVDKFK